ncbi:hypothetical protein [Prosthecobacter sp.]|uniref:hypothetical protein n=1 Tax=Prosthecobacter sp. TaxID=1965333 RepID=UPI002ABAA962|nr:hypothetical protein [Prosthecobacter sp.]MDZ4406111.1 hypothetical protein [Prosthecobacter sp.]
MNMASKLARITVVVFSLALLVAYVWHSHVTPNTPPPDPLGLNTVEWELQPEVAEFEGFTNHGSPAPPGGRQGNELRIISSKVINQPIFSARKTTVIQVSEAVGVPFMYVRPMMAGSKSGPVQFFGLHAWRRLGFFGYEIALNPYSDAEPKSSPPTPFPDWLAKGHSETANRGPDPFAPNNATQDPFAPLSEKPAP